ncbi:gliding motility-associated C-terminal domain-containing protein [Ascidiimonas sp. W6]|uniref:Ig-like domain-containing protein n=1 Tax=Ascidiimonas meishanensis TaxID=3128903 RepID=UPI0030ED8F06
MKKRNRFHIVIIMLCALVIFVVCPSQSQNLQKPVSLFSAPCASSTFNTYNVEFEWTVPLVNSDNVFILELSDGNGNFSAPTQLVSYSDKNTTFQFDFNFSFPTNTRGDNYKVRVRSTSPARTSPESDSFPAYYMNVRQSLQLGDQDGNALFGQFFVCDGEPFTLRVLNFPDEPSYRWYRNGNITPLPGENSATLQVTGIGFYYAEIDYGDFCSSGTSSNQVEIIVDDLGTVSINGPTNVEVCPGNSFELEANIDETDYIYRWYKDGTLANTPGYEPRFTLSTTDPEGIYRVEIENPGGCSKSSDPVNVSAPNMNVSISSPNTVLLLPGDTVSLTVTTSAPSPSYQWFKDGNPISGETSNSLNITSSGLYYATVVPGSGGCTASMESNSITVALPQNINIFIAADAPYADCSNSTASISISDIQAVTSDNNTVNVRAQMMNRFSYQWFKDGQLIAGETNNTLSIANASLNGNYILEATLDAFNPTSNAVQINLQPNISPNITSDGTISCSGASNITIISDVTDTEYTYAWYLNNQLLVGETTPILSTNLTGNYLLEVSAFGCAVRSNEIVINPFEESIVTVNADERIVIVEGFSRTVTASGADSYRWFNEQSVEISNTDTVVLQEEGQYILRAFVGDCEITKLFTVVFQDSFVVPNVISPNSDGINDQWVIPNSYAFKQDVEIFIYGPTGERVYRAVAYQNNWPESNLSYPANKPVFYYKIVRGKEILKQGTITLIR